MSDTQEMPEGVKLQTITINAATPDVMAAAIKKITDSVIEQISPDTFKQIAKEMLDSGHIIVEREKSTYYNNDRPREKFYEIQPQLGKYLAEYFSRMARITVDEYCKTDEFQAILKETVLQSIKKAMEETPKIAYQYFTQKFINAMSGNADVASWADFCPEGTDTGLRGFVSELVGNLQLQIPNIQVPDSNQLHNEINRRPGW